MTIVSPGRTNRTRNDNAVEIVPLTELREHVGLAPDDDGQDNIIQTALDAAIAQIEGMLNRSLLVTDVVDHFPAGFNRLRLSEGDITTGSIGVTHAETGALSAGDWMLDESVRPAMVYLNTPAGGDVRTQNPLQVSYTTPGYTSNVRTRERVSQAIKTLVAAAYQERTGADMEAVLRTVHSMLAAPVPSSACT